MFGNAIGSRLLSRDIQFHPCLSQSTLYLSIFAVYWGLPWNMFSSLLWKPSGCFASLLNISIRCKALPAISCLHIRPISLHARKANSHICIIPTNGITCGNPRLCLPIIRAINMHPHHILIRLLIEHDVWSLNHSIRA